MPRFVILEHDHPLLHWDFMLETGEVLRTWRLASSPEPGVPIAAELLADHRLHYLAYEGPVPGGRGHVRRWDAGFFTWQTDASRSAAITLSGSRCQGTVTLTRNASDWCFLLQQ